MVTSSSVSIGPAAVEAASPNQSTWSRTTDWTTPRTITASTIFKIGDGVMGDRHSNRAGDECFPDPALQDRRPSALGLLMRKSSLYDPLPAPISDRRTRQCF